MGRATAQSLNAKTIALGFDARESSPNLAEAVASGICDAGADVLNIGLSGTEEVYSAVSVFNADAGIEITASHNPIEYNGMKIVKYKSQPLSDDEFSKIKFVAKEANFDQADRTGLKIDKKIDAQKEYINEICGFVDLKRATATQNCYKLWEWGSWPYYRCIKQQIKRNWCKNKFCLC